MCWRCDAEAVSSVTWRAGTTISEGVQAAAATATTTTTTTTTTNTTTTTTSTTTNQLTNQLAKSMEQTTSWEAYSFSASQELSGILWDVKVHHRVHKCIHSFSWAR